LGGRNSDVVPGRREYELERQQMEVNEEVQNTWLVDDVERLA